MMDGFFIGIFVGMVITVTAKWLLDERGGD